MLGTEDVFKQYLFGEEDAENLKKVGEILLPYADEFAIAFSEYLARFPDMQTASFAKSTDQGGYTMAGWLEALLSGTYDQLYVTRLERVGRVHVKRDIPIHWVTASMNFKRAYLIQLMGKVVKDCGECTPLTVSLNKILDINLDILLSSYHEEELQKIFLSERMDSSLIRLAERFAYGLNIVLVLALIGLAIGVVGLFAQDVYQLFFTRDLTTATISTLGTLLIIWVIIELVGAEIRYLKGERLGIEIFVAVAMVSVIRELLIKTLSHEASPMMPYLIAAVLVLGVVYFLIKRAEPPA